jgi:hypothetical protein
MSRIIAISTPKYRALRVAPRHATRFGAGVLATMPHAGRMDFTAADEAELVQYHAKRDARNRRMESLARESSQIDRLSRSYRF